MEEVLFPIQHIETNRGREFFSAKVQKKLIIYEIKVHPNKSGSLHVNGKVERSQKTDKSEFYPTTDVSVGLEELDLLLTEWQHYKGEHPHCSLNGLTPINSITEISD